MGSLLQGIRRIGGHVARAMGRPAEKPQPSLKKLSNPDAHRRWPPADDVRVLEHELACRARLENIVPVHQPLVLISQVQRSGGTLLSQLFDMHPQCHAYPYELVLGRKSPWPVWPVFDLSSSVEHWIPQLFQKKSVRHFWSGYAKPGTGTQDDDAPLPYLLLQSLQWQVFRQCAAERPPTSQRDVFNCYFTSYFNAWLDNQNLYGGSKRYVVAFRPRMTVDSENVRRFFAAYPDGKVISVLRDPKTWYSSTVGYYGTEKRPQGIDYSDPEVVVNLWTTSTQSMIECARDHPKNLFVISFEELVRDTPGRMRALAAYLGIDFTPELTAPTFNGLPMLANSSFKVQTRGVVKDPLQRQRDPLPPTVRELIERRTSDLHAAGLALIKDQAIRLGA